MTASKGIYVRRGTRAAWAAEHDGQHHCQCGCGEQIEVRADQYPAVPKFRLGHNSRTANPSALPVSRADWAAGQQGRHLCACGCGKPVQIRPYHHSVGIPRYVNNHQPRRRPRRPVTPPKECRCGCGVTTAPGRVYVHGHNNRPGPLREVFLSKTSPCAGDQCWPWYGEFNANGYAVLRHNRRHLRAARVSFTLFRGPIPAGHEPDHTCRIRGCTNPWHLDAVTHAENIRRIQLSAEEHRALAPQPPTGWAP